jgi:glutathione peroxidase
MYKTLILLLFLLLQQIGGVMAQNAYEFSFNKIDGSGPLNLSEYKGKLIMVVNTASLCGFTKQYSDLKKLYTKYKDKGFVVIAVPSNNFANQEPSPNAEIATFCEVNFNIDFPITEKVDVQSKKSHPFFIWTREKFGWFSGPKWNFYKYLIDINGEPIEWFSSFRNPMSSKITSVIEKHLP